jgi:hypothetical protein
VKKSDHPEQNLNFYPDFVLYLYAKNCPIPFSVQKTIETAKKNCKSSKTGPENKTE